MQWLKNTQEQYSFGRIVPFGLFLVGCALIPICLIRGEIDNVFELILAISPMATGMVVYGLEIVREIKGSFSIKIGGKEYGLTSKKD